MKYALVMVLFLVGCGSEEDSETKAAAIEAAAQQDTGAAEAARNYTCEEPIGKKRYEEVEDFCTTR